MALRLNRYCQECVKFMQKECKGRREVVIDEKVIEWGQEVKKPILSGLKFCRRYEFDDRFLPQDEEKGIETFKDIRERQQVKAEKTFNQEIADDVDFGESLTSADFEGLPE